MVCCCSFDAGMSDSLWCTGNLQMHDKLHFLSRAGHSRVLLLLGISILLPGITAQDWKWVSNSSTLYAPRVTNVNFLLTIYRHREEERLCVFNDYQRKMHWSSFFQIFSTNPQENNFIWDSGSVLLTRQKLVNFIPPATACNEELLCLVASEFLIYIHTRCWRDFFFFLSFFFQTGFITESSTVSIFTRMLLKQLVHPSTLFLIKILLASNL